MNNREKLKLAMSKQSTYAGLSHREKLNLGLTKSAYGLPPHIAAQYPDRSNPSMSSRPLPTPEGKAMFGTRPPHPSAGFFGKLPHRLNKGMARHPLLAGGAAAGTGLLAGLGLGGQDKGMSMPDMPNMPQSMGDIGQLLKNPYMQSILGALLGYGGGQMTGTSPGLMALLGGSAPLLYNAYKQGQMPSFG